jgi:CRISPR/Cas system CMR-associated protein Cmr5 small subunit
LKEISEHEKTVVIRFANYSTLVKSQAMSKGLNAQLALFLSQLGGGSSDIIRQIAEKEKGRGGSLV